MRAVPSWFAVMLIVAVVFFVLWLLNQIVGNWGNRRRVGGPCARCGADQPTGARYCRRCGYELSR